MYSKELRAAVEIKDWREVLRICAGYTSHVDVQTIFACANALQTPGFAPYPEEVEERLLRALGSLERFEARKDAEAR